MRRAGHGLLSVVLDGYARAMVEVGPHYANDHYPHGAPEPWTYDPATERPPTVSAEQMYAERRMFHGPLFQGVTAVHALGERHVRGVVTAPPRPGALLDNALQLIGNWLITTQPQRSVALPVGIDQIRFFGPPVAGGTAFDCVARVRSIDHEQLVARRPALPRRPGVGADRRCDRSAVRQLTRPAVPPNGSPSETRCRRDTPPAGRWRSTAGPTSWPRAWPRAASSASGSSPSTSGCRPFGANSGCSAGSR